MMMLIMSIHKLLLIKKDNIILIFIGVIIGHLAFGVIVCLILLVYRPKHPLSISITHLFKNRLGK